MDIERAKIQLVKKKKLNIKKNNKAVKKCLTLNILKKH